MQQTNSHRIRLAVLALILATALIPLAQVSAQPAAVFINEIHYDNSSTDEGEAIEIAGPAGTDLDGWSIVLYNGNGGAVYNTTTLSGIIPDQQDGFGTFVFTYPTNGIQNGSPDGIALVDATNTVVQFLSYEGTFTAVGGPADGLLSTDIGVREVSSTLVGDSLQLVGTGASYEDFTWSGPVAKSYGAVNAGQTFSGGSPDYTLIYDIQYTTDPGGGSPYAGQIDITTEGIVTARFQYGYFIQDPAGDAWNGLWVHDTDNEPALGDRVRLTGTVIEYYDLTELDSLTDYQVESSGNPLPAATVLATGDVSQEQWESVLVRVEDVTVSDEDLGYGEWSVSDGSGDVVIDDKGSYTYTPVNGEALAAVIGPLDYSYGAFKILPRDDGDIILPVPPDEIFVNEIHYDNASTDEGEAIEIAGPAGTDLSGWSIVLYNGNGGAVYNTTPLGGIIPDQQDSFGTLVFSYPTNGIQNGAPDGIALVTPGDVVVQFLCYEGTLTAVGGPADSLTCTDIGVEEDGSTPVGDSLQLIGTGASYEDFGWSGPFTSTFGAVNSGQTFGDGSPGFGSCGDAATLIHEVQGPGSISPMDGVSDVVIEGVVVGDFQDTTTQLRGFFIQEEDADADGDTTTSEGVFVYDSGFGVDVNVGDVVRVQGNVTEYYGLTEVNYVSNLAICGTGASASAAIVILPVPDMAQWEYYEGMLITIPQTLYATDNYNQGRYGEVSLAVDARLAAPTNVVNPGADALALQDLNNRSRILMDDGSGLENPLPLPPYIGDDGTLRAGDTVPELTGVLAYGFSSYRIHPTQPVAFTRVNERTTAPPAVGGRLKVASFNVLNYFNGDGAGGGFPTPRGADTPEEFTRQRDKIISAILAMDADVVGLIEIENDGHGSESAIADLVNGLNDVAGPGTYAYVDPIPGEGGIGTDEIAVGFIYKPATVTPVGLAAILDSSVDPTFIDTKNRPALAQTFEENATGERFTAVVNHFKSKGSPCDDIGDPDLGDGQGNCSATRASAATALTNWLASDPTGSGDPDFLIIGDLNAYAMEDPITNIESAGYTNLIDTFAGEDAYSYVYYGQAGYLDHALANPNLAPQVVGATVWHINADEPNALNYNDYNQPDLYNPDPYRSSDHDPVLIGLDLFSAKPLENVDLRMATIHWMPAGDGQADFRLMGKLDLPEGFTRDDLRGDLTLCVTIAGETGCDTVTFTQHGNVWLYHGSDEEGSGMDIYHATIVWRPKCGAIAVIRGELNLPGIDQDTTPAEATIGLSLPVETPGPTPELIGEVSIAFKVRRKLWLYRDR